MKKRFTGAVALGAIAALALTGCAGGGEEAGADVDFTAKPSGTLSMWGFENADDVGQARLDYAAAQMPDVEITHDATAFDSQKLTTRVASGDVPDVVQMDRRLVAQYAAQDLILPLDACYEAKDVDPQERWYKMVADEVTWDDRVWGAPQFYQPPAIIVNQAILAQAGVSAEDFDTSDTTKLLPAIEKVYQEQGGNPSILGFDPNDATNSELYILAMGGQLTDADGKPTLDDPSNQAGIELLQQIHDAQGGFAKDKSFTDSFDRFGDNNQYVAGQVAAEMNMQWYVNGLSKYADQLELGVVPLRDAKGEPFAAASGSAFVIPAGAKNPATACAWITDVTSLGSWEAAGDARGETRKADGGINAGLFTGSPEADQVIKEKWVTGSSDANFDAVIDDYYAILDYGRSYPASPAGQTVLSEIRNAVIAVLVGEKSIDQALSDAQSTAMRDYESMIAD